MNLFFRVEKKEKIHFIKSSPFWINLSKSCALFTNLLFVHLITDNFSEQKRILQTLHKAQMQLYFDADKCTSRCTTVNGLTKLESTLCVAFGVWIFGKLLNNIKHRQKLNVSTFFVWYFFERGFCVKQRNSLSRNRFWFRVPTATIFTHSKPFPI